MRRNLEQNVINKSGNFESIQFSVSITPEMFQMLSSNLYSRPKEAIIRELSCNAWDSHVEAGTEEHKFDVKLPTMLEPTFYVRDYGTGLTPEKVRDVYTHIFASDKTDSNSVTGCFGVGSKSPFAYVHQFTVESIVDGTKWIYSAYLNDKLIPELADLSNGGIPTDQDNGIKVSFPVETQDIDAFVEAARSAFYAFDKKPNIIGYSDEDIFPEHSYSRKGDGWRIRSLVDTSSAFLRRGGQVRSAKANYATMGNVSYTIDMSHFPDFGYLYGLDIFFDLGDLNPAASREYLQYDDETVANITSKMEEIKETLCEPYIDFLKDCTSLKGALEKYRKVKQKSVSSIETSFIEKQAQRFVLPYNDLTYDLTGITTQHFRIKNIAIDLGHIEDVWYKITSDGKRRKQKHLRSSWDSRRIFNEKRTIDGDHYKFEYCQDYYVVIDEQYAKYAKIKWFAKEKNATCLAFVIGENDKDFKQFKKNLTDVGIAPDHVLKVSDIDRPKSAVGNGSKKLTTLDKQIRHIRVFNTGYKYNKNDTWQKLSTLAANAIPEKAWYVCRDRNDWKMGSHSNDHRDLDVLLGTLKDLGVPTLPIYSVTESKLDLIPDEWVYLPDLVTELAKWIEDAVPDSDYKHQFMHTKLLQTNGTLSVILQSHSDIIDLFEDPKFKEWADLIKEVKDNKDGIYEKYRKFANAYNRCISYADRLLSENDKTNRFEDFENDWEAFVEYFEQTYSFLLSTFIDNYSLRRAFSWYNSQEEVSDTLKEFANIMNMFYNKNQKGVNNDQ